MRVEYTVHRNDLQVTQIAPDQVLVDSGSIESGGMTTVYEPRDVTIVASYFPDGTPGVRIITEQWGEQTLPLLFNQAQATWELPRIVLGAKLTKTAPAYIITCKRNDYA